MSIRSLDIVSCAMAMIFSMAAQGASVLHLDGILLVNGLSMAGARVIIVSEDAAPIVITEGLAHFTLDLDLQTEYLLSFEREGCVSKELRFSTMVPDHYLRDADLNFPFQVTLAPPSNGRHFTYAGPVGYIHFDKKINAFGYDTDYRIAKDEILSKRLELIRTTLGPPAIPVVSPVSMTRPVPSTLPGRIGEPLDVENDWDPNTTLAPTLSEVAPKVHVLEMSIREQRTAPARVGVVSDEWDRRGDRRAEMLSRNELPPPVPLYTMALATTASHYSKEVEADKLRVITTITVKRGIRKEEFRRVVSYYGGTSYFCKGRPCSEWTYNLGLTR